MTGSTGGGDGTIGPAEDGDYNDGLYTDFTDNTLIGVPIDRFNELFKILAPSPAPALSRVNYISGDGETAKLSFGYITGSKRILLQPQTQDFQQLISTDHMHQRLLGTTIELVFSTEPQHVTGTLNFTVAESVSNGNVAMLLEHLEMLKQAI